MIHTLTGLLMLATSSFTTLPAGNTTSCDSTVRVPSAFSPNGDGINDCFQAVFTKRKPLKFKMQVYNRWGNMVMETEDWKFCWDTTITDKKNQKALVPGGVYFWTMSYEYEGFEEYSCTGNVTIMR
jgi:gliding motility-associated-like protein